MVSEYGFVKTKSNALTTEAFAQWLRKREISECFIAGADAAACVKSTCYNMAKGRICRVGAAGLHHQLRQKEDSRDADLLRRQGLHRGNPGRSDGVTGKVAPQLVKKEFDKLVDGRASSPARCRVSNLRFEPSAVSPSAKPENPLGFQPSCHPYQFLLKSFRFPGAKTARKFERALALSSAPRVFRQSERRRGETSLLHFFTIFPNAPGLPHTGFPGARRSPPPDTPGR